jgi:Kef-type K+ transport system membrane component KefB
VKRLKNISVYGTVLIAFGLLFYWITQQGEQLEVGKHMVIHRQSDGPWLDFLNSMNLNFEHPFSILMIQIIVILIVSRIFAWIFRRIGQPTVIGEIVAGILLGPSLLGYFYPEIFQLLFPLKSLGNLNVLSQVGLVLFMFIVGMELDFKVLKNRANEAIFISQFSIIFPFALGMILAFFLFQSFAPVGTQFLPYALFIGIAMSITAFPVLARIVRERGMHNTRLGSIVITCAAVDDITGWCLLAAVIAITKAGSFISSIYVILMAIAYVSIMFMVVRPFLKRIGELHSSRENLTKPIVAIFFLTLIISSFASELIGIHALFGAFIAGTIMPDNAKFRNIFVEKVEDVSMVLLLPLFFVFTGLRTQVALLNELYIWEATGLIILVAIIGKFLGSALASRYVKLNWKDSLTIGALMNTRGLMELIVLNIGYELGVLTPEIFAMMVIMALLTTFMTGPALSLINKIFKVDHKAALQPKIIQPDKFDILVSFGNPERGRSLLKFANALSKKSKGETSVTALHFSPTNDVSNYNIEEYEIESFSPILEEASALNQKIVTLFKVSNDITSDIIDTANAGKFDLLLLGPGQSIYEGSLLGKIFGFTTKIFNPDRLINTVTGKERLFQLSPFDDKIRLILARCENPVGILIERSCSSLNNVILILNSTEDVFLLKYAQKLAINSGSSISLLPMSPSLLTNNELNDAIDSHKIASPDNYKIISEQEFDNKKVNQADLIIISMNSWIKVANLKKTWVKNIPSIFVVKR